MGLQWLTGKKTARSRGRDGVVAILADVSGSMEMDILTPALRAVAQAVPGARVFVFADAVAEAPHIRQGGKLPEVGGGTSMEVGLSAVAQIAPQLTIVLSDGGVYAPEVCYDIADRMTGAISCLWFGPDMEHCSHWFGHEFMENLARRGGGDFRKYSFSRGADVLVRELLHFVHRQQIHHHYAPSVHVHHGYRPEQTVQRAASTVRITRR